MNFESSMQLLDKKGFSWDVLREIFPFGDISLREGNYQKLVEKVLSLLNDKDDKELLLDLLDTQNCIFLEQVWIQNEKSYAEEKPFPVYGHFISAQLQINSNFRFQLGLRSRDARAVMLKLPETELLLDRICK